MIKLIFFWIFQHIEAFLFFREELDIGTEIEAQYPEDYQFYNATIDDVTDFSFRASLGLYVFKYDCKKVTVTSNIQIV